MMTERVVLVLATSTGGVGRHVASLVRGLVAAGHEVTVCGPQDTEQRFGFTGIGARFAAVEIAAGPDPVRDMAALICLRRTLGEVRPSVIHAHGLRAGLVAVLARRRAVPLVITWHNLMLADGARGRVYRVLERLVARGADVTLCASSDLIGRVLLLGGRDVRFGPVAAPVLDPATRGRERARQEIGVPDDRPVLLSVARLNPQKSLDVLVHAAARWRQRQPVPLVLIAGSGPSEAELRGLVETTGAPVRLLGHRTDVADLLDACDLAVVTSRWEARQLFAQEALTAGRPLVATAVGGIPELVGGAAVLVPPGDVDALDAAVGKLLDDASLRDTLAKNGRARAAEWPTEEDTVRQVAVVYHELTGRA